MGAEPRFIFEKGDSVYLQDVDGNRYLDMTSGIFTNEQEGRIPCFQGARM